MLVPTKVLWSNKKYYFTVTLLHIPSNCNHIRRRKNSRLIDSIWLAFFWSKVLQFYCWKISSMGGVKWHDSGKSLNEILEAFQKKKQHKKWIWHFFHRYPPSLAKSEKNKNENWSTIWIPSLPVEIVNQMTNFIILFDILDSSKRKLNPYKATKSIF